MMITPPDCSHVPEDTSAYKLLVGIAVTGVAVVGTLVGTGDGGLVVEMDITAWPLSVSAPVAAWSARLAARDWPSTPAPVNETVTTTEPGATVMAMLACEMPRFIESSSFIDEITSLS